MQWEQAQANLKGSFLAQEFYIYIYLVKNYKYLLFLF